MLRSRRNLKTATANVGSGRFGHRRLGAADWALDIWAPDIWAPGLSGTRFFFLASFSIATVFRFVDRFARVGIEESSRNRFVLNGIQGIACFIVFSS